MSWDEWVPLFKSSDAMGRATNWAPVVHVARVGGGVLVFLRKERVNERGQREFVYSLAAPPQPSEDKQ